MAERERRPTDIRAFCSSVRLLPALRSLFSSAMSSLSFASSRASIWLHERGYYFLSSLPRPSLFCIRSMRLTARNDDFQQSVSHRQTYYQELLPFSLSTVLLPSIASLSSPASATLFFSHSFRDTTSDAHVAHVIEWGKAVDLRTTRAATSPTMGCLVSPFVAIRPLLFSRAPPN